MILSRQPKFRGNRSEASGGAEIRGDFRPANNFSAGRSNGVVGRTAAGINVDGRNLLPMPDLAECFVGAGVLGRTHRPPEWQCSLHLAAPDRGGGGAALDQLLKHRFRISSQPSLLLALYPTPPDIALVTSALCPYSQVSAQVGAGFDPWRTGC